VVKSVLGGDKSIYMRFASRLEAYVYNGTGYFNYCSFLYTHFSLSLAKISTAAAISVISAVIAL